MILIYYLSWIFAFNHEAFFSFYSLHISTGHLFFYLEKPIPYKAILVVLRRRQWHPTTVLLPGKSHGWRSLEGCSPWGRWGSDTTERLHFHFSLHALEKEMATHSSVLAWRIPGTAEPGGLPSMGSHRVRHDWSDLAAVVLNSFIFSLSIKLLLASSNLSDSMSR